MIKRLLVELSEVLCDCLSECALDIEQSKKGQFELQIVCTKCKTYLSTPLSNIRAVIAYDKPVTQAIRSSIGSSSSKPSGKPKLVLIQGGAESKD